MARYTCASDAAATGSSDMEVKNCPNGPPNSLSICSTATVVLNGTTESCNFVSSSNVGYNCVFFVLFCFVFFLC